MLKFLLLFLESFLLKSFFKKEEYDINSKHFNVFKLVVFGILLSLSMFSFYFIYKIIKLYIVISENCPTCLQKLN